MLKLKEPHSLQCAQFSKKRKERKMIHTLYLLCAVLSISTCVARRSLCVLHSRQGFISYNIKRWSCFILFEMLPTKKWSSSCSCLYCRSLGASLNPDTGGQGRSLVVPRPGEAEPVSLYLTSPSHLSESGGGSDNRTERLQSPSL